MADIDIDWDLISSYAGLLTLASGSIFAGAFGSLPKSITKKAGASKNIVEDDDDGDDDIPERLSTEDAWLFPVVGSVALFGLYVIIKYLGAEWINWFLKWYFSLAGIGSVWKTAISFTRLVVGHDRWKKYQRYRLLVLEGPKELTSLSFRTPSLFLFPLGVLPSLLYSQTTAGRSSALLTDILGVSFSHNALSLLKIDSFKTGTILLAGLFFYDIYWVFGTEVMVKVATSLDVPIKLLWPKSSNFSTTRGFTMLGLGDIVIPGIFVALALRYDHARAQRSSKGCASYSKPYFIATLLAYVAGLVATMTVMHCFKTAQPALLYLSPACILSFVITGLARGELSEAWNWVDVPGIDEDLKLQGERSIVSVEGVSGDLTEPAGGMFDDVHTSSGIRSVATDDDVDAKLKKRKGTKKAP